MFTHLEIQSTEPVATLTSIVSLFKHQNSSSNVPIKSSPYLEAHSRVVEPCASKRDGWAEEIAPKGLAVK
jgi:hypothetical protein